MDYRGALDRIAAPVVAVGTMFVVFVIAPAAEASDSHWCEWLAATGGGDFCEAECEPTEFMNVRMEALAVIPPPPDTPWATLSLNCGSLSATCSVADDILPERSCEDQAGAAVVGGTSICRLSVAPAPAVILIVDATCWHSWTGQPDPPDPPTPTAEGSYWHTQSEEGLLPPPLARENRYDLNVPPGIRWIVVSLSWNHPASTVDANFYLEPPAGGSDLFCNRWGQGGENATLLVGGQPQPGPWAIRVVAYDMGTDNLDDIVYLLGIALITDDDRILGSDAVTWQGGADIAARPMEVPCYFLK